MRGIWHGRALLREDRHGVFERLDENGESAK
jgi:hypothetical protein